MGEKYWKGMGLDHVDVVEEARRREPEYWYGSTKKETADKAKPHGQPITENNVDKTKDAGAGQKHGQAGANSGW